MFEENEDLVTDVTENVEEQATEELVDGAKVVTDTEEPENVGTEEPHPVKTYTQEELDKIVDTRVGRALSKAEREFEKKYSKDLDLANITKQGIGIEDSAEAAQKMNDYYVARNIEIKPRESSLTRYEDEAFADRLASDIIADGLDEVISYGNDLASKGVENMTNREKLVFSRLNDFRKSETRKKELESIGAKAEVYESKEFKDFASQYKDDVPVTKVYEQYTKSVDKPRIEKLGPMKTSSSKEEKTFYTPEEVDRLTPADYNNPNVMKYVRESMTKWK